MTHILLHLNEEQLVTSCMLKKVEPIIDIKNTFALQVGRTHLHRRQDIVLNYFFAVHKVPPCVGWASPHYGDVIMGAIASQITSLHYSNVYSDADQRKNQSSASLALVGKIHREPVNSPHKWPVIRKMFPFDDVIMGNNTWMDITKCFGINVKRCHLNPLLPS